MRLKNFVQNGPELIEKKMRRGNCFFFLVLQWVKLKKKKKKKNSKTYLMYWNIYIYMYIFLGVFLEEEMKKKNNKCV